MLRYKLVPHLVREQSLTIVAPSVTVLEACRIMKDRRIGAVMIAEDGQLTGIFSERDAVARVVAAGRDPATTMLAEAMTPNPQTVLPDDYADDALRIMQRGGFRHLPIVCEDGRICGMVSIRDIYGAVHRELEADLQERDAFITGYSSPNLN